MKSIYIASLNIVLYIALSITSTAQSTIKTEKIGSLYTVPCSVNGLKLNFIFDTGATDVSISETEAIFMLKNGYLTEKDFIGSEFYRIANGDIQEGTKINIKEIKIGNIQIHNTLATVIHSLSAPLLLGQSALEKLGSFSFDYKNNTLVFNTNKELDRSNSKIESLIDQNFYSNEVQSYLREIGYSSPDSLNCWPKAENNDLNAWSKGIRLKIKKNIITTIYFFKSSSTWDYKTKTQKDWSTFKETLPNNLKWDFDRKKIISMLGNPDKSSQIAFWDSYKLPNYELILRYNDDFTILDGIEIVSFSQSLYFVK